MSYNVLQDLRSVGQEALDHAHGLQLGTGNDVVKTFGILELLPG